MQWKFYPDFCIENIENIQIFEKSTFQEKFTSPVLVPSFEKIILLSENWDRFSGVILIVLQSDSRNMRKVYLRFGHFLILESLWMTILFSWRSLLSVRVSVVALGPFFNFIICVSLQSVAAPFPDPCICLLCKWPNWKLFEMYSNRC